VTGGALIYLLGLMTSLLCAGLLWRAYARTRAPLLAWSGACFAFLALNNVFVVLDMLVVKDIDLSLLRQGSSLAAIAVLLYGFIWEVE
jgi:cell division protein FtsW (lipid II flippase)